MADRDDEYDEEEEELDHEHDDENEEAEEGDEEDATGAAAAPVAQIPVEELPEEKPFTSEAQLHFGGTTLVKVNFAEPALPAWLRYIVTDDEFWFKRTVAKAAADALDEGDDEEDEGAVDEAEAPADNDEEEGEGEQGKVDGGAEEEEDAPITPFDPNMKLVLEYSGAEPMVSYTAKIYVPPLVEEEGDEDDEEGEGNGAQQDLAVAAQDPDDDDDDGEEGGARTAVEGDDEEAEDETAEEKHDAFEIIIDVFTLCAVFSPAAFKYCLTWKPKEESGVAPLSFAGLEDWCLHTVGDDALPEGSLIRSHMITAAEMLQADLAAAHDKEFREKAVAAHAEAMVEEAATGGVPDEEEDGDEDGAAPAEVRVPLKAEDVQVPSLPLKKIPFDFSWVFEKISANSRNAAFLQETIRLLLQSGYNPSNIIDPKYIRNSKSVQALGLLLMRMPRSTVNKWMQPNPNGEDEDGGGAEEAEEGEGATSLLPPLTFNVGTILLDVRTRNAKTKKGKANLRRSGATVHAKYLPKKFDTLQQDPLVSDDYATRTYAPQNLELRGSDLLLLILTLTQPEFTLETFTTLYTTKVNQPRELNNRTGLFHVLFHSLPFMDGSFGEVVLALAPQSVLCGTGLVNPLEWVAEISQQLPHGLNGSFAQHFWDIICSQEAVMDILKVQNPELHSTVLSFQDLHSNSIASIKDNSATVESLDLVVQTMGARTLCTPTVLYVAVEAINQVVAEWLFAVHKVTTVQPTSDAAPILALQHSLETRNVAITSLFVHHGADLRTMWDNGKTNGLIFIADNWAINDLPPTPVTPSSDAGGSAAVGLDAFSSAERKQKEEQNAIVEDLLALWKTREFERATDPKKKYGLLLSAN